MDSSDGCCSQCFNQRIINNKKEEMKLYRLNYAVLNLNRSSQ